MATLRRHRPILTVPDTGSLRGDLVALLTRMSDRLAGTGSGTVYGLLGEYLADADAELFDRLRTDVLHIATDVMTTICKRAAARGEARPDLSPRIASLRTDLFRNELLRRRTQPTREAIAEIVDALFLPLVRP